MGYATKFEDRVKKALEIARCSGGVDGAHHKMWAIDQMVRSLTGCPMVQGTAKDYMDDPYTYECQGESEEYLEWVKETKGEFLEDEGCYEYDWDEGIPP